MVKVELYVPGIKSHEMVDIAHCEIVEGSRGKRHRLYGTYTDPTTKKIHKVNSFATKAKYDKAVAEMTEGMPVEDITITQVSHFAEDSPLEADASELGGPTEPDNAGVPADVGGDEPVPMGDEPRDIQEIGRFDAESKFDNLAKEIAEDYREKGKSPEEAMKIGKATAAKIGRAKYGNKKFAKMGKGAEEADLTGIIVQDNDPSSPPEGIFASDDRVTRPEAYDKVYNAIDFIKRNNLKVTLQEVGNELHDDGYMTNDEKEAFYYIMDQKNAETSGEVRSWEAIAMDMINPDNITIRDLNAEMTLREWGESELEESKHDFAKNPNEPFHEWLDEEVKTHGDITFKEWADEEETEDLSAEQITKSAESDTSQNTIETQVAVGLGIPPEIWLSMPRSVQDEYISSMDLDVMYIRELAQNGGECDATGQNGYGKIMELANSQKQDQTSGDLSLIECNVCGISASQLLQSRGGVCEITDPMLTSAGEANPNYLKGVSCPFEKYYSLTQAVDNAVDREREENRTVIQLVTPRSVAYAAEELLSVTKVSQALNTFAGQRISKHSEDEVAGTYECYCSYCAGVVELDADECPHCGTVDFDVTDGGRVNYPSYGATDADYECSCETPRPRHVGVHPTVCQYCNLIIEAESFGATSFVECKDESCDTGHCSTCGNCWDGIELSCSKCGDDWSGYSKLLDRELYGAKFGAESWSGKCQRCGVKSNASTMSWFNTDLICMDCADKEKSHPKYQEAKDRENEEVQKGNLNYDGIGFDAEYQDYVYVGNDEKCKLNGFYWSMMNNRDMNNWIIPEQEPTDFYNQFGQKVSNAETFNSDSWDNLYVVAENRAIGWEACDVTNGVLQTYSNQDDAEREAKMTIDDLNSMYEVGDLDEYEYDEDSWAGKRLSEVDIADNVEFIKYPNGQIAPYPPGRSANTGHHLEATRGIDTFTEPFENESPVNRLQVVGILAAVAAAVLIAKRL